MCKCCRVTAVLPPAVCKRPEIISRNSGAGTPTKVEGWPNACHGDYNPARIKNHAVNGGLSLLPTEKIHERVPYWFHSLLAKSLSYQHNQNRHHDVSRRVSQLFVQHHFHKRGQQVSQQNCVAHQRQVGDANHLSSERGTDTSDVLRRLTHSRPGQDMYNVFCMLAQGIDKGLPLSKLCSEKLPLQHHCCSAMPWNQNYTCKVRQRRTDHQPPMV